MEELLQCVWIGMGEEQMHARVKKWCQDHQDGGACRAEVDGHMIVAAHAKWCISMIA